MASLMDSLGQALTPEAVSSIGNALGLDPQMVQQGVNVVGPLVEGGLANSTSSQQGLDSLMQMITPPADGAAGGAAGAGDIGSLLNSLGGSNLLGTLLGAVTGQGGAGGGDMVSSLLSGLFSEEGMAAIGPTLDKALGFKVSGLIPLVAPLLIGMLAKKSQEEKLDATAIASMLQEDQKSFLASGSKEVQLVQDAMKAGQDAVALKGKFTPEEWTKVRLVPMAASALIIGSAPSNAVGVGHEVGASMQALMDSRSAADPVSLLNIAFNAPFTDEEKQMVSGQATKEKLIATLKEGAGIVASKDPSQMDSYRQVVMSVATAAAKATKEGGFLGFGSKDVNKAEQAALNEIASILKS